MFLIDTDHLSIMQREGSIELQRLKSKLLGVDPNIVFASTVSFHEQTRGIHNFINKATKANELQRGYDAFLTILKCYAKMTTLTYDEPAHREFERLRRAKVRIGTMDLRIASTAVSRGLTLITRNMRDFERVPDLKLENWTA